MSKADGTQCILLEPYDYRWFRLGGQHHLLPSPVTGPSNRSPLSQGGTVGTQQPATAAG
jgi:hypothetical protein